MNSQKKNNNIQGAIVEAVAFFDLFDFPMTEFEIWQSLSIKCSLADISQELKNENKYLEHKNGFWFLQGRSNIIDIRARRYNYTDRKFKRAIKISKIFKFIPWIKMIGIGNIIGSHNLKQEGDIDFFIITEKNRIWITRFFCVLITNFLGLRPKQGYIKDKICLSFFIDESEINLEKLMLDLNIVDYYFVYWLAGLVPIYDKEDTYNKLIKKNYWLKKNLPNWNEKSIHYLRDVGQEAPNFYRNIVDAFFGWLEKHIKSFSLKKFHQSIKDAMKQNEGVIVNDHVLKFHINDRRREFLQKYKYRLSEIGYGASQFVFDNNKVEKIYCQEDKINNKNKNNYLEKIIKFGLYLIAFLLPLQTRLFLRGGEISGGYSEYLTISLYGVDIILVIVILLYSYIAIKDFRFKTSDLRFNKLWWLIGGLDLIIFISIFFSEDKWLAFYKYLIFLLGIGIFWLITSARYNKIKLLWSFIGGVSLQAILGIYQFLFQSSFASKWLGLASHNSRDLGVSVIEAISSDGIWERWLRAYGGFDHPNMFGGVMAIGLIIVLSLYLNSKYEIISRGPGIKKMQNLTLRLGGQGGKFQTSKKYLLLTSYFLLFVALIFSFSRAAWLGFVFALIIILFFLVIQKDFYKQRELLIIILISSILSFLIYSQYSNLFQTRLTLSTRLENISYVERVSSIKDSAQIIKNNFFIGTGIGNYVLELKSNIVNSHPSWYYQPVHNTFLLVWSELGFFGLLSFVSVLLYLFWQSLKQKKYFNIALLISLFIIMMFDHWLWSLHFGILFFWFIIGLIYKNNLDINNSQHSL